MTDDVERARHELRLWLDQMQIELDEERLDDPTTIHRLREMVAETFANWRVETGWGMRPGSD